MLIPLTEPAGNSCAATPPLTAMGRPARITVPASWHSPERPSEGAAAMMPQGVEHDGSLAPRGDSFLWPGGPGMLTGTPSRICYFKRYRMEIDLNDLSPPELPEGYEWLAWDEALLDAHAEALYGSFYE